MENNKQTHPVNTKDQDKKTTKEKFNDLLAEVDEKIERLKLIKIVN